MRILVSVEETMLNSLSAVPALEPELAATYQQGFEAAVRSMAIAFGVAYIEQPVSGAGQGRQGDGKAKPLCRRELVGESITGGNKDGLEDF
jgi:hypothetical protein